MKVIKQNMKKLVVAMMVALMATVSVCAQRVKRLKRKPFFEQKS